MAENPAPETLVILGVPFHNVTFEEAVSWAMQRIRERRPAYIATANVDFLMQAWRDPEMQRILLETDLVIADGQPIVALSPLFGPRLKQRVTGSDLTPLLAAAARDSGFSVFGLGGAPGIAQRAMQVLGERYPGLRVAGTLSPPQADILDLDHLRILETIEAAAPDIVLVAFGAPKQEKWSHLHIRHWKVPLAMGVGGTLDFLAGVQTRAPRWVQRLGAEWIWRMGTNPRRLLKRYAANLGFLFTTLVRVTAIRLWPFSRKRSAARVVEPAQAAAHGAEWIPFAALIGDSKIVSDAQRASEPGPACLVVDMQETGWLNSRDLGRLSEAVRQCRRANRAMVLVNLAPRNERLLRLYRFDRHIGLAGDAETLSRMCRGIGRTRDATGDVWREQGDTLVYRLPIELTAANADSEKQHFLLAAREAFAGPRPVGHVRFDAGAMVFLDSSGLGFLVSQCRSLHGQGITAVCTGLQGAALRTVEIARVRSVLMGEERKRWTY